MARKVFVDTFGGIQEEMDENKRRKEAARKKKEAADKKKAAEAKNRRRVKAKSLRKKAADAKLLVAGSGVRQRGSKSPARTILGKKSEELDKPKKKKNIGLTPTRSGTGSTTSVKKKKRLGR